MVKGRQMVTVSWLDRKSGARARVSIRRRTVVVLGGVALTMVFGAAALGVVAARLYRDNVELTARWQEGEARVLQAEAEMAEAWEGLAQVRREEAKIRQWLGLDPVQAAATEPADAEGGQGSLGDVDLAAVAPEALAAGAGGEVAEVDSGVEQDLGSTARDLATALADLADRIQERKRYWDAIPTITPVEGEHWMSSGFGWRKSPFTGEREFHSGIDLAGERGTPIVAAADGTVVRVVKDAALGRAVTVDHGNGLETIYGHLDKVLVGEKQRLARGQELGKMGSTGRRSTGPHLHYAVRKDGKYVNPKNYLLDRDVAPYPVALQ